MIGLLARGAWAYRGFIGASIRREFEARYRNSVLGAAWTVLQPLSLVAIYTIVFSQLMRARVPGSDPRFGYAIYLCAGVLTWGFFAQIASRGQTIFIDNANLIKKLSFPKICLPVIAVAGAAVDFAIIFAIFTLFLVATGNFPGWPYAAMLPLLLLQAAFAIGLGVALGVLNVFFRDVGHFFGIALQFWFWLTPIVYTLDVLPPRIAALVQLNPMTPLVVSYHRVLVEGLWPLWSTLVPTLAWTIAMCIAGVWLFAGRSAEMVDEL